MYYFIDKNQTQQGPFSIEELLLQNDFNASAFVWTKGMKDWKPASEIDELQEFLGAIPPVIPHKANEIPRQTTNKAGSNGIAIAGFILALATLTFCYIPVLPLITAVLAFIFSVIGVCRKKRKIGLGIAGTVISIIALAATLAIHAGYAFTFKDAWKGKWKIEQHDDYDYDWD